ncbi:hypothetical protein EIP91_011718 [Steccherinum ochraceum]|uniref:Uncharacterized protein n=1 Tax=Steccherinum ochraceum TaxID=92696 RepID=A0A4R0RQR4_9APHY|nr:hypothetical protein EIP91_011718 [Steccherinum ochraceum]
MIPLNFASGRPKPPKSKDSALMDTDPTVVYSDPMSVTPDHPGPSMRTLMGSIVGLLDNSQKDRVLSAPDSTLTFATFHPLTASGRRGDDDTRRLSAKTQLDHSKRIVIETLANGQTFFRWVPRARGVDSVSEEGQFPRKILILGEEVIISQEQWDIYKLDPFYDCYIPGDGGLSTISATKGKGKAPEDPPAASSQASSTKRSFSTSDSEEPKAKKQFRRAYAESDDEDEEEVVEIVEDEHVAGPSFQKRKDQYKAKVEEERRKRRTKISQARNLFNPPSGLENDLIDLTMDDIDEEDIPAASTSKHPMDDEDGSEHRRAKMPRLSSQPPPPSRLHPTRLKHRTKSRADAYQERQKKSRLARDDAFFASVMADAQSHSRTASQESSDTDRPAPKRPSPFHAPPPNPHPEKAEADPVSLQEKIRRMQELNQHEASATARKKEEERQRKEAELLERQRAQEAVYARRRSLREHPSWARGPWTFARALDYYRVVTEYFESEKFTPEFPLSFEDIPWPVLFRPGTFKSGDIDNQAVEAFFAKFVDEYRDQPSKRRIFLTKSQQRIHYDRFASRRLWIALPANKNEAEEIKVAQNTVSQAINGFIDDLRAKGLM